MGPEFQYLQLPVGDPDLGTQNDKETPYYGGSRLAQLMEEFDEETRNKLTQFDPPNIESWLCQTDIP